MYIDNEYSVIKKKEDYLPKGFSINTDTRIEGHMYADAIIYKGRDSISFIGIKINAVV